MEYNNNRKVRLLHARAVAERLGCSVRFVYTLIEDGSLPALKIGKKRGLRVREEDLEAFIRNRLDDFYK